MIRTGFELSTPKMAELAAGSTVTLHEVRQLPDGTTRACIQLSGSAKRGWCTMIGRDGDGSRLLEMDSDAAIAILEASNRHRRPSSSRGGGDMSARGRSADGRSDDEGADGQPSARSRSTDGQRKGGSGHGGNAFTPRGQQTWVISSPKPLLVRGDFDLQSGKVGELAPGTKVHILETRPLPDGGKRVRLALQDSTSPYGWVTAVTKSGQENLQPHLFEVVSAKPLVVRAGFDTKSKKVGEIANGTLLFLLETRETADGSSRMRFALAQAGGGMIEGGWVTSITKDGAENVRESDLKGLRAAAHAATRSATGGVGNAAAELDHALKEARKGGLGKGGGGSHVGANGKGETMAAVVAAARAVASSLGKAAAAQGGGTAAAAAALAAAASKMEKQGKGGGGAGGGGLASGGVGGAAAAAADGIGGGGEKKSARGDGSRSDRDHTKSVPTTPKGAASGGTTPKGAKSPHGSAGPSSARRDGPDYDKMREELKAKVAKAREEVLKLASKRALTDEDVKATRYVRNEAHRPSGRADEMPSRHRDVAIGAPSILMFNCNRCSFEVSAGDISTLPDSDAIDIKSLFSHTTLGRVKIPPEKGTPFVERVEFPNEWRVGDEHGLIHDGLQGDGELEMRIEWRVEDPKKNDGSLILHSAILKVNAWLAYGCAEGARLMMRKAADTMGKCCTVQRVLRDDSVVVRVDGVMGESTVDPTPLTVVRTSSVRHEPGTRLLYLHDKVCVDAVVEPWPEKTIDVKEGSRHRLRVLSQTVSGWVTWKLKDGTEFLKQPKDAEPADFSVMTVHGRALKVSSGFIEEKGALDKTGTLPLKQMVNVLEVREQDDGTIRANVTTIAETTAPLTAALNDFNHSVQRFDVVAEYEAARTSYCEDIVEREQLVEDAITGNMLRIKDQTLHVSTATDVVDNVRDIPPEWRVDDVRDMVVLMLVPSPHRPNGMHSAQPVLVRAGPGTGKTWMSKQAVFTLADKLKANSGSGIRLVPIVVYVQRIVFLIREGHTGGLLTLYIEACYTGRAMEGWRKMLMQAYEMRALIVLIDGVDEAAGLRDEIEAFVHKELVPSGNRVLVTSRPEGVTLPRYTGRFVIMNLNELTNEQQRKVISIQMNGSAFFDHLLSLGEVRKWLDDAYGKLRESVQGELETLYSPNRFKKKAEKEERKRGIKEVWDPEERQKNAKGDRFIAERAEMLSSGEITNSNKPHASCLQLLDRQLNAFTPQRSGEPLLERIDVVVRQLPPTASKQQFSDAVLEDMYGPSGEAELRHHIAVELGLFLRRLRLAAGVFNQREKRQKSERRDKAGNKGGGGGGGENESANKGEGAAKGKASDKEVGAKAKDAASSPVGGPAGGGGGFGVEASAEAETPLAKYAKSIPGIKAESGAAAALWCTIVARVDELYMVAEKLHNTFESAMRRIAHEAGRDDSEQTSLHNAVQIAELKSPIRAHEKAIEEYEKRFSDGVLPEACITDVLRCRMAFSTVR